MAVTATAVLVTADDATYTTSRCVIPARLRLETWKILSVPTVDIPKGKTGVWRVGVLELGGRSPSDVLCPSFKEETERCGWLHSDGSLDRAWLRFEKRNSV